jgi:hypothetical protein
MRGNAYDMTYKTMEKYENGYGNKQSDCGADAGDE